jgi:predicted dinucleotide-binding enzyme
VEVTIIGAGNMGRGIGTRLVAGGNQVRILDTDPAEAQKLAEELQGSAAKDGAAEGGAAGDALSGDVVVLALWYEPAQAVIDQYRDQLGARSSSTSPTPSTSRASMHS